MLIGGYALPAYGRIRATLDVDMAIDASFSGVVKLYGSLRESGYQPASSPQPDASLFVLTDLENMVEIEVWTKPDGIVFDEELLRRRVRVRPFNDDFEMFAVGPEDFIVNKLARKDRGVQDEQDVISVLKRRKENLDYDYLARRAKRADVFGLLETLKAKVA